MSPQLGAYLEIPAIDGKIIIPASQSSFHVGKREFQAAAKKALADSNGYNAISSVKRDNSGAVISEHFIIKNDRGNYSIQDLHSTNGTYLDGVDLKKSGPRVLKDGDPIVVPIEEHGKLISLQIIFRIATDPKDLVDDSVQPQYQAPTYNAPQFQAPQYSTPQAASNTSSSGQSQPQYYDPSQAPTVGGATGSPNAKYYDPSQDQDADADATVDPNSSQSFILKTQIQQIPKNAFAPNSGIDLSMVYRLEQSELWHIGVAFVLLFVMIYHTYINIMLILLLVGYLTDGYMPTMVNIFLDPLPIAIIFGLSFIVHELSHLNTGKHFGYQSRFCLTNVGIKVTKKAVLIGLPFGLPGAAVSIGVDPAKDTDKMGWIKFAGPLSNFILGVILMIVSYFISDGTYTQYIIKMGFVQGATLNFVLGCFNMIPKEIKGFALDGKYIIMWRKNLYIALIALFVLGYIVASQLINLYQVSYASNYVG